MGRIYVCNGAQLKCTMGTSSSVLVVLPERKILLDGQPQANIMDYQPNTNIQSFGLCFSLANPVVAAATAAHLGILTPMPCVPNTTSPWVKGEPKLLLKNFPALCQDDTLSCMWAGTISIVHCGQGMGQGAFPLSKQEVEGIGSTSKTNEERYKIVLKDAYWEKNGMKIRLLPHQKKVKLCVVFSFEPDEDGKNKKDAEFNLKILIPRCQNYQENEIIIKTIKGSKLLDCEQTEEGYYKYPIDNFTSDLSEIDGTIVREI